jgi:hypothetical protein
MEFVQLTNPYFSFLYIYGDAHEESGGLLIPLFFDYYLILHRIQQHSTSMLQIQPTLQLQPLCELRKQRRHAHKQLQFRQHQQCVFHSANQTYINWDGVHYTEAYYSESAKMLLTGRFVSPPLNLSQRCGLSFKDFRPWTTAKITIVN